LAAKGGASARAPPAPPRGREWSDAREMVESRQRDSEGRIFREGRRRKKG
jgi:hypothetical protein